MSKNVVFEGWLTKSPPSTRIWKTKWRRRWFALRQSGELPGQYFLDYYTDCNCRQFKGTINLDFCEQVDAGLHMERDNNCSVNPRLRGSVFAIQTQSRTYHLEADCEAEMEKWVDAICRVCGLRATYDTPDESEVYRNRSIAVNNKDSKAVKKNAKKVRITTSTRIANNSHYNTLSRRELQQRSSTKLRSALKKTTDMNDYAETTGPYIPISECITGARPKERAFTFDGKNIVVTTKATIEKTKKPRQVSWTTPVIMVNNKKLSDNDSDSDEEGNYTKIGGKLVSRRMKRLSLVPQGKDSLNDDVPPPVPPRPPKTFAAYKDSLQGPHSQEPLDNMPCHTCICASRRMSHGAFLTVPGRPPVNHNTMRTTDDEDEAWASSSMQYCNLSSIPPAVDRTLKPKISIANPSHCISTISSSVGQAAAVHTSVSESRKRDVLQYLDLDLPPSTLTPSNKSGNATKSEEESAYKTVDFVRTEAFNSTRADAEAFREAQL